MTCSVTHQFTPAAPELPARRVPLHQQGLHGQTSCWELRSGRGSGLPSRLTSGQPGEDGSIWAGLAGTVGPSVSLTWRSGSSCGRSSSIMSVSGSMSANMASAESSTLARAAFRMGTSTFVLEGGAAMLESVRDGPSAALVRGHCAADHEAPAAKLLLVRG